MKDAGIKDTAAYRVVSQMISHSWPSEEALDDGEFVSICHGFSQSGGSWEAVMDGDPASTDTLEQVVDALMQSRKLSRMARVVAGLR
jgi:hypothetical protein